MTHVIADDYILKGMGNDFPVGRYHSWIVDPASLPASLVATSYDEEGNIMSLRHVKHPLFGTQFHPESIISTHGRTILEAFLQYAIATERR